MSEVCFTTLKQRKKMEKINEASGIKILLLNLSDGYIVYCTTEKKFF